MMSFLLPLALLASSALAQTSTICGADYIVEACLNNEKAQLATCGPNEWDCLCNQWKNIVTCYNNCPDDPRVHDAESQANLYCGYVTQFATSTTAASAPTKAVTTPAKTTAEAGENEATRTASASSSPTSTGGAAKPNSAADLAFNAGGILAAVAGAIVVVL